MATKRRHATTHSSSSRKRARLGLGDITNSPCEHLSQPKAKKTYSSPAFEDQLVPGNEFHLENTDTDSMYCTETIMSPLKRKKCAKAKTASPSPGGLFSCIPPEVLHTVLSMLEPQDIHSLSISSHAMRSSVCGYVYSSAGLAHILPTPPASDRQCVSKSEFVFLGKIMKGMSMFQQIKKRLKLASFFLDKLHPVHSTICGILGSHTAYKCLGLTLHAFVTGWNKTAKTKVYELIKSNGKLLERTKTILQAVPGSLPWHEKDVRSVNRQLFLCPTGTSDEDYGFWLSLILKPWPLVFQAKLLYLLTAPGDASERVYWTETCGCSHLQHTSCERLDFSELARALRVLYHHKDWTEDDIVTIFNELTSATPNGWCLENVGLLLFGCGTAIVKGVLGSKAINGRVEELGMICYYMANCCVSGNVKEDAIDEDISWLLHILAYLMQLFPACEDRDKFITDLVAKWQTYLLALFEDYDPSSATDSELEDFAHEFRTTVYSLSRLCQSLMQSKINSMCSSYE